MTARADRELAWREWLLSDHPLARAERARRRSSEHERIVAWHEARWSWAVHTLTSLASSSAERRRAWHIVDALPAWAAQAEVDAAEPDDSRVQRQRCSLVADQRHRGQPGYRYPARCLGARAASLPQPPAP